MPVLSSVDSDDLYRQLELFGKAGAIARSVFEEFAVMTPVLWRLSYPAADPTRMRSG